MNTCDDFLAMKPDPPGDMGKEPLEKNSKGKNNSNPTPEGVHLFITGSLSHQSWQWKYFGFIYTPLPTHGDRTMCCTLYQYLPIISQGNYLIKR